MIGIIESKETTSVIVEDLEALKIVVNIPSDNYTFTVPMGYASIVVNGTINFGDGGDDKEILTWNSANKSNTYATAGNYTISLKGTFTTIGGSSLYIELQQWGTPTFKTISFYNSTNMIITATDTPNFSETTSIDSLFRNCTSITTIPSLNEFDFNTGNDIDASFVFNGLTTFNQDISSWYTNNFIAMDGMFKGCTAFNQDISGWNTAKCTTFASTFELCDTFNQPLTNWNVSSALTLNNMFTDCTNFNQPLNHWNPLLCTNFSSMFDDADAFNQDLNNWDVSSGTNFANMFWNYLYSAGVSSFNGNVTTWDVSNATNMSRMFAGCEVFNQDISGWNVSKCTNFSSMFDYAKIFNQNISGWVINSTSPVNMSAMLRWCSAFDQNIGSWNMSQVTTVYRMLRDTGSINFDVSDWDISNVTDFREFIYASSLTTANYDLLLSKWSLLSVNPSEVVNFGSSVYTIATSQSARDILTNTPNLWTIQDGGGI